MVTHHFFFMSIQIIFFMVLFVCVEVLWPSQPIWVMSNVVSYPNHIFNGQA